MIRPSERGRNFRNVMEGWGILVCVFFSSVCTDAAVLSPRAFFWLVSLLLSSLVWFVAVQVSNKDSVSQQKGLLVFGVLLSVLLQELFRFAYYKLLKWGPTSALQPLHTSRNSWIVWNRGKSHAGVSLFLFLSTGKQMKDCWPSARRRRCPSRFASWLTVPHLSDFLTGNFICLVNTEWVFRLNRLFWTDRAAAKMIQESFFFFHFFFFNFSFNLIQEHVYFS